jgi:hypothetical protein
MLQLTGEEASALRSQNVILDRGRVITVIVDEIKKLKAAPPPPPKRRIGFKTPEK